MLLRDMDDLRHFFGRFAPEQLRRDYGLEIRHVYKRGALHIDSALTGRFECEIAAVDMGSVMHEIDDARAEKATRRVRMHVAR